MITQHEQVVTFNNIRGGRFSAGIQREAAQDLVAALERVSTSLFPQPAEKIALKVRLETGQPMSQGDVLALVRLIPHFTEPTPLACKALEQLNLYVRERVERHEKRSHLVRSPLSPPLCLPPRPTVVEE